ncbi:Tryptophan aminotransferase-related protein 2 [Cardamine amara subsp. amara]|uniref:Tryptophan aminotransferase-related protein 2 n=1 Tax=Cardamine amara subsp. amara TaxID=228776 RepID=A0ABD1A3B5_CARAN
MEQIPKILSWRNMLVLSLALNFSLVLRILNGDGEERDSWDRTASVSIWPTTASGSSSLSSASCNYSKIEEDDDRIINLQLGDPTVYERYWQEMGDVTTMVIPGWQSLSYLSDKNNLCWFLEPELGKEIIRVHKVVGNAVTQDRFIVVGTGSTQLYQAALYALSPHDDSGPINVVSAAPYYSSYPLITDCLKSGLYRWGGDAMAYKEEIPYIELVTSPNNPDGFLRQPVVNRSKGVLIHDLAYYWPQYTPIISAADHDVMLFTVSKSTGHAGMRIGWALVKDRETAEKMTDYIELNTIGVSKDSQLRAAKVLKVVSDSCGNETAKSFFDHSYDVMSERWKLLKQAVKSSKRFTVPDFASQRCNFFGKVFEAQPAFAWFKCEEGILDCERFLREEKKILTKSGKHFGDEQSYVRISMLDRDTNFNIFIHRISSSFNSTI